jgi:uncharacterized protein YnzC (UPF0291/DUF896 family)
MEGLSIEQMQREQYRIQMIEQLRQSVGLTIMTVLVKDMDDATPQAIAKKAKTMADAWIEAFFPET